MNVTTITTKPSALSWNDEQMRMLQEAAAPLTPFERSQFLRLVTAELKMRPCYGDGDVHRACRLVQQRILRARDGECLRGW
jgi:hypothetical protein